MLYMIPFALDGLGNLTNRSELWFDTLFVWHCSLAILQAHFVLLFFGRECCLGFWRFTKRILHVMSAKWAATCKGGEER
jgi:hypothetical protein